jgi:hypothetical protein
MVGNCSTVYHFSRYCRVIMEKPPIAVIARQGVSTSRPGRRGAGVTELGSSLDVPGRRWIRRNGIAMASRQLPLNGKFYATS